MKKKLWHILLALAATLCLCFGLSACSFGAIGSVDQGEHQGGSQGGGSGTTPLEHTHTFAAGWSHDEEKHWHTATCGHDTQRSGEAVHTYEDGKCTECNYEHEAHVFGAYEKTESGHSQTCSVCGKVVTEAHTYANGVCEDCEYEHASHTYVYSEKTETGHTETCSACGKTVTGQHAYENGKCTTCEYEHASHAFTFSEKTETGHTETCSVCGKTVTEDHTYEKGICSECNYAHQNHNFGAEGICSVCGTNKPYTKSADGTKIFFGEYPQTQITDENDSDKSLRNSLNMAAGSVPAAGSPGKWTDYGYYIEGAVAEYMWYLDTEYQGSRYRGVYFTSYRPYRIVAESSAGTSSQDDNGYEPGTVYWFKYEPIEWRILKEKDGRALLMANIILDSQQYYRTASGSTREVGGTAVYENNYKESDIRKWLTETFYETAFDEYAQEFIEITEVDNSAASTEYSNPYVCENTQDRVFLLSFQEVLNTSYRFGSGAGTDATRRLKSTDYAKSQGCAQSTGNAFQGNGWWWLRSPYAYSSCANCVERDGYVGYKGVFETAHGVVPALWIKL